MISFTFGYTIYEAIKLDRKLGGNSFSKTGSVLQKFPEDINFKTQADQPFNTSILFSENKKVFIHFWATWCGPCEVEFPELVEFLSIFKDRKDYSFLLVAVNDDDIKVKKFLKKFKLDFDNIMLLKDDTNEFNKFGTYKLPESLLFNFDKKIIRKFSGQQAWSQQFMVDFFKNIK